MNQNSKFSVLFLCTHNSARSQMAEAFLKEIAGDFFEVHSAGLQKTKVNPLVIKVMEEIGFDMSNHYSKKLSTYLGKKHFDIVITVCSDAEEKCPIMPGVAKRLHWPFEDPSKIQGTKEEKLEETRKIRDQIKEKILFWLQNEKLRR